MASTTSSAGPSVTGNSRNESNDGVLSHVETQSFYQEHCAYLFPMLGWFLFSALLSSYNKYVFGEQHLKFPCPLLLTSIHFGTQWAFAHIACRFIKDLGGDRIDGMTWRQWALVSIPCGLVTSGDVGLSNLSMVHITITFYTMIKASAPIFVLFWAYWFGLERITWGLISVVAIICFGEFLTVSGQVNFNLTGFLLCLSATALSGMRWTLVQVKLQNLQPPLATTIATMKLLAPSMCLSMVALSIVIEKPWAQFGTFTLQELVGIFSLGLAGASLAICMILCEFWLILHASAVILMIGGVIKELVTITVGVVAFGDQLNSKNVTGCLIVLTGVALYKVQHTRAKHAARQQLVSVDERDGLMRDDSDTISPDYDELEEIVGENPLAMQRRPAEQHEALINSQGDPQQSIELGKPAPRTPPRSVSGDSVISSESSSARSRSGRSYPPQ